MMEQRHLKHNNKGYTLVEMIITMAIIVVLSGLALVTISMINSAKAREASVKLTSELSDMYTKSKNQMVVIKDNATGDNVKYPKYSYCMMLYYSGNNCYIKKGYYNPEGTDEATKYIFVDSENVNDGKGTSLSSRVTIKYTDKTGSTFTIEDDEKVYILFDRTGRCIEGVGEYSFYKKNGNVIANVQLKTNGSYQTD
ncbi:MAG: prepilin-type N-terminal cleavage/methylation domain-containing protein [Lachnospiraceae bacterium]|nr:prepilin-type N-terminal cleavage/methylation domain-containing protein [Lachnospiraceae bacterium]